MPNRTVVPLRALPLLLLGLLAACETSTGAVLRADVLAGGRRDVVAGDAAAPVDGAAPADVGARDVVYRDLPPTDWSWPDDVAVDPVNSIAGLQQDELGLTCDPSIPFLNYPDPRTLTGVVVMSRGFEVTPPADGEPGRTGYHVAEAPGAWHGVQLVVPDDIDPGLQPGDVVDVVGEGREFYCLTQFEATEAPTVTGISGLPPATDVAPETLAPDGSDGEPYEGTLVRLQDVTVSQKLSWGFALADGGVLVQDSLGTGVRPATDCPITSLTGVVSYSFEEYKIVLLRAEDVTYGDPVACVVPTSTIDTVVELQESPASAQCDTYDQPSGYYPPDGDDMELAGLVVTTPRIYVSSNLRGYYLQEPRSAPWAGVLAVFGETDDPGLALGDEVTVRGDWQEYRCLTQVKVAQPVADNLVKTGEGEVPPPVDIDAARAAAEPDYAEQFEGVLVRVTDQTVTAPPTDANFWQVELASGLHLSQAAAFGYDDVAFTEGQTLSAVTGVLYGDTYNENAYLLAPRSAADIVTE